MKNESRGESRESSYYKLHTGAVDDLVSANAENTPKYSQQELDRYRSKPAKRSLPSALKIGLIKAWFYGAVCYFVLWGLGMYVIAQLDLWVVTGIVLGMVTDLLINVFLRFMEKREDESRRYIMVSKRGVAGFLLNLLYGCALMFMVVTMYGVINALLALIGGPGGALFMGVGPLGFGVFAALADSAMIACKHLLLRIVDDARRGEKRKEKR